MPNLTEAQITAIEPNLFPKARSIVRDNPGFPWHRDSEGQITASQARSSQALAIDFFGTIKNIASRDVILARWMEYLKLHLSGPWEIELEAPVPKEILAEQRLTQIDALARGGGGIIAFECKFTEPDGGACSQPKPLGKGAHKRQRQCNGNYEMQLNPVTQVESRCALSGKGIRYWEFVPEVMNVDPKSDYRPCPFADGRYQWMRNLVAALALGRKDSKPPAFIVVYADGPFPMAKKIGGDDWKEFEASVAGRSVPLRVASYQQLLGLAYEVAMDADRALLKQLDKWIADKIKKAVAQPH